jgi:hypothetical protein
LSIAVKLKIAITAARPDEFKDFTLTLYNCLSPVETGVAYYYAAMLGSTNPIDYAVTLPYTSAISYLEFCNTFVYEFRTVQTTSPAFDSS